MPIPRTTSACVQAFCVWLAVVFFCLPAHAAPFIADGLGNGTVPIDGPWQFHMGDNLAWAQPGIEDETGQNGWESIQVNAPWGAQTHPNQTGYAWYRRHLHVTPAPGASPDVALLIPAIDDVYELYWNGTRVGGLGSFPPRLNFLTFVPAQTYGLGPIRDGVLAVRVLKLPNASTDDGASGGFEGAPVLGSPRGIANLKDSLDYRWLRGQQFRFGLTSLYVLTSLLSFVAWLRGRNQPLLFWLAAFTVMPLLELMFSLRLPFSGAWLVMLLQWSIQVREVCQWFLLVYLLQLEDYPQLLRFLRISAWVAITAGTLDGGLSFLFMRYPDRFFIWGDAALTAVILPFEILPGVLVLIALFRRKRLDAARWLVAAFACTLATWYSVSNFANQGLRYTHWTLSQRMGAPLLSFLGNQVPAQAILRTLLFASIVFAVIRYAAEYRRRQATLEQEYKNARELQQILVPEALPEIPGFRLTSAYRPAQEVGGDFFQVIPLEGQHDGSTLIVLGDVSGKGLKAAMTVSLIIGALRTLAESSASPARILEGLNRRLHGRLEGGFATCIALRLDANGGCMLATAGHPAPFLNRQELVLPGALPLGILAHTEYQEIAQHLRPGDHLALYTDGLLEARNAAGELYGFERLGILFGNQTSAEQASEEAVAFGQDDDVTVLTLTCTMA